MHLNDFFAVPAEWANPALIGKWARIRELRRVVTGALELARADKKIGSSLEADTDAVMWPMQSDKALFDTIDLAEIAITSAATVEVACRLAGALCLAEMQGRGPIRQRPLARNAPAAGGCWRKSYHIPTPISATAAPMRSPPWSRRDGCTAKVLSPAKWG